MSIAVQPIPLFFQHYLLTRLRILPSSSHHQVNNVLRPHNAPVFEIHIAPYFRLRLFIIHLHIRRAFLLWKYPLPYPFTLRLPFLSISLALPGEYLLSRFHGWLLKLKRWGTLPGQFA